MEQVKAACGCQYILNSWFYDTTTGRPVGNLKIDGAVKAAAGWNVWGLTWDKGADIRLDIVPDNGGASYLSGVELLIPARGPGKALSYSPEYGGTRGRSAVLLAGARVILYCSGDGTADDKTPEGLRDELVSIGCRYDQAANLRAWASTRAAPLTATLGTASVSATVSGSRAICVSGRRRTASRRRTRRRVWASIP